MKGKRHIQSFNGTTGSSQIHNNTDKMDINADAKKITILGEYQDSRGTYYIIKMETDKGISLWK